MFELSTFGGTSGATPFVTRAISDVAAVLPDIQLSEIKALLKHTNIGEMTWGEGGHIQKSETGEINAYKLVRVAQRIKALQKTTPRAKLLENGSLYDFSQEATTLLRMSNDFHQKGLTEDALKAARQSWLLNPTPETGRLLSRLYSEKGLSIDALYYELFFAPKKQRIAALLARPEAQAKTYAISLALTEPRPDLGQLESVLRNPSAFATQNYDKLAMQVVDTLYAQGEPGRALLARYREHPNEAVKGRISSLLTHH